MKFAIATAFAAMTLAGSALAETRITVTLDAPQSAHADLIAASALWSCNGATCVAASAPDTAFSSDGCQDIAKQLGRVASYTGEMKSLGAKALEKCNKVAATAAAVGTASR